MDSVLDIIAAKRDARTLSKKQIHAWIEGICSKKIPDYQASALLMAIFLNGMRLEETVSLTEAMRDSGHVYDLSRLRRPKVDKHSTGGVGDKVSLILAPLAASVGLSVPMMSGRGLGHTGGTLDKLEAIPGFSVEMTDADYVAQLEKIHVAMIGQSEHVVPADRILYALRDVTSTVESMPLICSSILSKKHAEGIDALVLDVKCGRGAFLPSVEHARELARMLVDISQGMGMPTRALITDMNQPLGRMVGNALEVREVIDCLRGNGPEDLMRVTNELTAEMMLLAGLVDTRQIAFEHLKAAIANGAALSCFRDLIEAQKGDSQVVEQPDLLPRSDCIYALRYDGTCPGYISILDAKLVGQAAHRLGAGRETVDSLIDPAVGIECLCKVGDEVEPDSIWAKIHYNTEESLQPALELLKQAVEFSNEQPELSDVLIERVL